MQSVSLEDIPAALADLWGITEAAAQVLLSIVVILAVLLPVMYLSKGKSEMIIIVMTFITISMLVGIGWLPFWILIAIVSVMAIAWAFLGSKVVVGGD